MRSVRLLVALNCFVTLTKAIFELSHDGGCLAYAVQDSQYVDYVWYCFEIGSNDSTTPLPSSFTFGDLRTRAFTPETVLSWGSAPIDLIERYAAYLLEENKDGPESHETYINCSTSDRFGSRCQYTFEYAPDLLYGASGKTFFRLVEEVLLVRGSHKSAAMVLNYSLPTCDVHIECDRGPAPLCLDWREVCDGKVDCTNGADEHRCEELEINMCTEDEYRCTNGMCIPASFFNDDYSHPDCLDGTDELLLDPKTGEDPREIGSACHTDGSFACVERMCRYRGEFVCGDNYQCGQVGATIFPVDICPRQLLFNRILYSFEQNKHLGHTCWSGLVCLLKVNELFDQDIQVNCKLLCKKANKFCVQLVQKECVQFISPNDELIFFPTHSMLGYGVRFVYNVKRKKNWDQNVSPNYICLDLKVCPLPQTQGVIHLDGSQCIPLDTSFPDVTTLYAELAELIYATCTQPNLISNNCSSSLIQCGDLPKCISRYRWVDHQPDCADGSDEEIATPDYWCILSPLHHFKCSNGTCISPNTVMDGFPDCSEGEDETTTTNLELQNAPFPFSRICDGLEDTDNGSDEIMCHWWPCSNQYTQCNHVWNCPRGEDELDCAWSKCNTSGHECLPSNAIYSVIPEPICLPIDRINDGSVDCIGSIDERAFCRARFKTNRWQRFRCAHNSKLCVQAGKIDGVKTTCANHEKLWRNVSAAQWREECENQNVANWPLLARLFCFLTDEAAGDDDFTLVNAVNYPDQDENRLQTRHSVILPTIRSTREILLPNDIPVERAWYCAQGIWVRERDTIK